MNLISKLKHLSLIAFVAMASQAHAAEWGGAKGGQSLGQVSKNISNSFVDGASALEAFLYLAGIVFIVLFIFTLVKWKKTDGREGNMGLIAVYLLAGAGCMAAPTLMSSGIATVFGGGTVQTIQAPQPNFK